MTRTVLAIALLLAALPAQAQTYLDLAFFDRERPDCWGLAEDETQRCTYNLRATLQLEIPLLPLLAGRRSGVGVGLLARSEITANTRNRGEAGHTDPVKGDFGGGLVLRWQAWSLTLFGASRHCFDFDCPAVDTYNALILRWTDRP